MVSFFDIREILAGEKYHANENQPHSRAELPNYNKKFRMSRYQD